MEKDVSSVENTSGQGRLATIPEEIRGWNWGAFLLNWIWGLGNSVWIALLALIPWGAFLLNWIWWLGGLGNSVWIALLALIPYVVVVVAIVLGVKGNEWAWRSRKWDSIEHFKRTQRTWTKWGVWLIVIIPILFFILAAVVLFLTQGRFIG